MTYYLDIDNRYDAEREADSPAKAVKAVFGNGEQIGAESDGRLVFEAREP